jgi:hypothetical protein
MELNRSLEVDFLLNKIEEAKEQNEKRNGLHFPFLFSKGGRLIKAVLITTKRGPLYTCFAALGEGLNYNGIFFPLDEAELSELEMKIQNVPTFCDVIVSHKYVHTVDNGSFSIPVVKFQPHKTVLEEYFNRNNALRISRKDALKHP